MHVKKPKYMDKLVQDSTDVHAALYTENFNDEVLVSRRQTRKYLTNFYRFLKINNLFSTPESNSRRASMAGFYENIVWGVV